MRRTGRALAAAVLAAAACARVEVPAEGDGGTAGPPRIADLQPPPGEAAADAQVHVIFSEAIDDGQLLAATCRSQAERIAPDALACRAAAAIAQHPLSS